jgi:hypothetical protein
VTTSIEPERERSLGPITYLAVVAAIAALGGLVFVVITYATSQMELRHDTLGHTVVPEFTRTPAGMALDGGTTCTAELAAAAALITASESGAENWLGHIQARSDGMAGLITNEEMREIWRVTREAGPDDVEKFADANDAYASVEGACEEAADTIEEFTEECATSADLAARAVDSARTVIGEWHGHQENMATFADGGMTADQAQSDWEEAWARAPDDFAAYDEAVAAFADAPGCAV